VLGVFFCNWTLAGCSSLCLRIKKIQKRDSKWRNFVGKTVPQIEISPWKSCFLIGRVVLRGWAEQRANFGRRDASLTRRFPSLVALDPCQTLPNQILLDFSAFEWKITSAARRESSNQDLRYLHQKRDIESPLRQKILTQPQW
jgi:hypothetical protein